MRQTLSYTFLLVMVLLYSSSRIHAQSSYCSSGAAAPCTTGEYIHSIWTTNTASDLVNINTGCSGNPNNYTLYTYGFSQYKGQAVDMHIVNGPSLYSGGIKVYVDYNMNGTFDAIENVYLSTGAISGGDTVHMTFYIPNSSVIGTTRMRVIMMLTNAPANISPCGYFSSGEVEDYEIAILPPCNGSVDAQLTANALCNSDLPVTIEAIITPLTPFTSYEWWEYPASNPGAIQPLPNSNLSYTTMQPNTCYYIQAGCTTGTGVIDTVSNTICTGVGVCQDSVWPGDANHDLVANIIDYLAICVKFGETGTSRANASNQYSPQFCYNWNDMFTNGINTKNADCNGNGIVEWDDTVAIIQNYGQYHLKTSSDTQVKITTDPDLYFDWFNAVIAPGIVAEIPIRLGTSIVQALNVYGIAGTITQTGISQSADMSMGWTGSWLAGAGDALEYARPNTNSLDVALCRTDHHGVTGEGVIGVLYLPVSLIDDPMVQLQFNNIVMIDSAGNELPLNVLNSTIAFLDNVPTINGSTFSLFPNPAHDRLKLTCATAGMLQVYNMQGTLLKEIAIDKKGAQALDIQGLIPGNYITRFHSSTGPSTSINLIVQ